MSKALAKSTEVAEVVLLSAFETSIDSEMKFVLYESSICSRSLAIAY